MPRFFVALLFIQKHISKAIWLFFVVALLSSCDRRYNYRITFRSKIVPKKTVEVKLVNYSPEFLSPEFEAEIRQACMKRLSHYGFSPPRKKDTANYTFYIQCRVDSYYVYRGVPLYQSPHAPVSDPIYVKSQKPGTRGGLMELTLTYHCYTRYGLFWEDRNQLYFFANPTRDTKRGISMMRNSIRNLHDHDLSQ